MAVPGRWDLWGTQRRWEDPALRVLNFPLDYFTTAHFDEWLLGLGKDLEFRICRILDVLSDILRSMEYFVLNMDDCLQAFGDDPRMSLQGSSALKKSDLTSEPKWQYRLGPLLRCVIRQHLRLFQLFCDWAAEVPTENSPNKGLMQKLEEFVEKKAKIEETFDGSVFQLQTEDPDNIIYKELKRDFDFLEDKWVCRSALEITLLILRCYEQDVEQKYRKSESEYLPRIEREKESLKNFLEKLKKRKSCIDQERAPPCVPQVICFDETSLAIGASKPSWPNYQDHKMKKNPWKYTDSSDFFTHSRDSRISSMVRKYHFEPAAHCFDKLVFKFFMHKAESEQAEKKLFAGTAEAADTRAELHDAFGTVYFGPLRQYEHHVWQAIESPRFIYKDQCVRCQVYWNATLVHPNGTERSCDTKSCGRIDACAESCLHAELAKGRFTT